jgi:Flp pilus assembly protein TadG
MTGAHRADPRRRSSNSGSAALELVLLTPVLVALLLFIVFAGRAGEGMSELRHAADQGARAASQASRTRMQQAARAAVLVDLRTSGLSCVDPTVALATAANAAGTSVTVTVTCRVSDLGLRLLRIGPRVIEASSTEIIDRFRSET